MRQNIIKLLIIIVHVIIGLMLIFIITSPIDIYNKMQNPKNYWPNYSVSQIVAEDIGGIVLGILSILGALAFRKDKRWTRFALPVISVVLVLAMFISANKSSGLVAGPTILFALALFVFFIAESAYMVFKKQAQIN